MKWLLILALALSPALHPANRIIGCFMPAAAQPSSTRAKFAHLRQNAERPQPDPTPTVLTEDELNTYLASGELKLPAGVQSLRVSGQPGVITARGRIDFDAIVAGARSPNPLLTLFSGVHDVEAVAQAFGANGQAQVHIDTLSLDGVAVPRLALDLFARRYLKPRYPNLGLDSTFAMPAHISSAAVGAHTLTLVQH